MVFDTRELIIAVYMTSSTTVDNEKCAITDRAYLHEKNNKSFFCVISP